MLQGEREMATDNRTLGRFDLVGIPPAPRGVPQIEVTFDIDANGIVHVSAKDLGTGKEQKIRIEASSGLSEDEIQKMVKDADLHAEEDKKKKGLIEARNQADNLIYTTEKTLKEHGEKVGEDDKKKINEAIEDLKKNLTSDDVNLINQKIEAVTKASYKLAEEMYKANAQNTQNAGGANQQNPQGDPQGQQNQQDTSNTQQQESKQKKDDSVEDADYEVVDDDK